MADNRAIRKDLDNIIQEIRSQGIKHNDDYDSVGVGDVVESVLSRLGITQEKFKELFNLQECNCTERKKWLNGVFHWRRKRKGLE
jgi:hypothetical protein